MWSFASVRNFGNSCIFRSSHFCTLTSLGPAYNEQIDAKKTARCRKVLGVTKLSNIAVNDFNANKSIRCRRVLVVTEFVVSGTHCSARSMHYYIWHIITSSVSINILNAKSLFLNIFISSSQQPFFSNFASKNGFFRQLLQYLISTRKGGKFGIVSTEHWSLNEKDLIPQLCTSQKYNTVLQKST